MAHSLMYAGAKVGMDVSVASPEGYECNAEIVENAKADAKLTGAVIDVSNDPESAVKNADVVYTDTWVSMGQEEEKAKRIKDFEGYTIDEKLFSLADSEAVFMHCLPAYRGYEVTEGVIDGPNSVIFDEAENRLHVQKAVMALTMGD